MTYSNPCGLSFDFQVTQAELIEDVYVLSKDKFTADKLYHGGTGEKVVLAALKMNYKKKNGFNLKYNKFDSQYEYCCGQGMDLIINYAPDSYKTIAAIEVKNLADQNRPYGTDFVRKHVLPRADGLNCRKILVITFKKLLTKTALELLGQQGWTLIIVGERLTYEFFHDLKKLYALAVKIKAVIPKPANPNPKPAELTQLKQKSTDLSCLGLEGNNTVCNHNHSIILQTHDTPKIINGISEDRLNIIEENLELLRDGYNIFI